jgi:hypothetical protein
MLETFSVASVNRHLTLLRAILNRGIRDGRLDPAKKPANASGSRAVEFLSWGRGFESRRERH